MEKARTIATTHNDDTAKAAIKKEHRVPSVVQLKTKGSQIGQVPKRPPKNQNKNNTILKTQKKFRKKNRNQADRIKRTKVLII